MMVIRAFVDTSIVNRILDIDIEKSNEREYEDDREYLSKIISNYVKSGLVRLLVNPSVEREIRGTKNLQRKKQLLASLKQFHFTAYHLTVFPIILSDENPATFINEEEKETLEQLFEDIPSFRKDEKIFADAVFNGQIGVLLTTDREHLANDRFRNRLKNEGLDKKIKVFTPKEFFDHLQSNI